MSLNSLFPTTTLGTAGTTGLLGTAGTAGSTGLLGTAGTAGSTGLTGLLGTAGSAASAASTAGLFDTTSLLGTTGLLGTAGSSGTTTNGYGTTTVATPASSFNFNSIISQLMSSVMPLLLQMMQSLVGDLGTTNSGTSNSSNNCNNNDNDTGSSSSSNNDNTANCNNSDDTSSSNDTSSKNCNNSDDNSSSNDSSNGKNCNRDYPPPPPYKPYTGGTDGKYWGDPHLEGFDGEKYDVMGQAGNTYNMLSDKDVQYNTTFKQYGDGSKGATVIDKAGIQVGDSKIEMDSSGDAPTLNGKAMTAGQTVDLDKNGSATWDGKKLGIKTNEYNMNLQVQKDAKGDHIDSNLSINKDNFGKDGVAPHGLLGQTADGVDGQHKGVNNTNDSKNGGTVIDGTVSNYQTTGLFDNNFKFNQFVA